MTSNTQTTVSEEVWREIVTAYQSAHESAYAAQQTDRCAEAIYAHAHAEATAMLLSHFSVNFSVRGEWRMRAQEHSEGARIAAANLKARVQVTLNATLVDFARMCSLGEP